MAIQFSGLGSGLDVDGIVSKLMDVERRPLTALDKRTADYKAQLSAYGGMKSTLSTLQAAARALTPAKLGAVKASVGDGTLLSASASPAAAAGTYSIEVEQLAQAQKLKSPVLASAGTGALTVEFGSYDMAGFHLNSEKPAKTITIAQSTLAAARDAINAADAGVRASVVNDGSGDRLVIASNDTGASSALRITVDDADGNDGDAAGLSRLAFDASGSGASHLAEAVAALDAKLHIDGIAITSASNEVGSALEGVTLSLKKAQPGTTTTLSVARDIDGAKASVDAFVKAYNDAAGALRNLSAYDPATRTGAVLQGDSTLISVQTRLRSALASVVDYSTGYASLSELGIAFQRDGTLAADSVKLRAALADTSKNAASALAAIGAPSDSEIAYSAATSAAVPGSYAVNVTQLATRGFATGSAQAVLTIAAGVNDTLQLAVDGKAATVTLAAGSYSAASLAAMLQSRISGVDVSDSAGVLTLSSKSWGSASRVAITGGNAAADLFGAAASTDGVDAAGSIGGKPATGAGRNLTASGLTVSVLGGATGARGTLLFSRGAADRVSGLIDGVLTDSIGSRTTGIAQSLRDLDSKRNTLNARVDAIEKRYRAQFIALDNMMASMNSTSSYLQQQLANLPKVSS